MKKIYTRTAVILCGGKGTRLGLLGQRIPKCLVKVQNRPIIWYIINILRKNSFNHFILPIGYKGHMIKKFFKLNKTFKDLNIEIVETGLNTNIAKRIFLIKKKIISKNFLLLNGDAIFDFDLNKIYQQHENKKFDMTFVGCENQLAYGTVGMINGKIVSFDRNITFNAVKVKNRNNFTAHVYSGTPIMNVDLLKMKFKNYANFEKKLFPKLIKKFKCNFVDFTGFWHSIDNTKDIEVLKKINNKNKFNGVRKILKKIYKFNEKK